MDAVATPSRPERQQLSLVDEGPTPRELVRALAALHDDVKWLDERFTKLQNRVTTELREIRREVDRFFDEPNEEE